MAGEAAQAGPVKRLDDALAGRDAALLVLLEGPHLLVGDGFHGE